MNKIPILILTGPTAVGKTKLSIELAKKLNAEIISADSMQIYKYMDIGSAKVTEEEMEGIPHHLIDIIEPDVLFSVSEFKDQAEAVIEDIHKRGKLPIITGGTGLYLNSLIYDMNFGEVESNIEVREELEQLLEEKGSEYLYEILKSYSMEAAERIHPNNTKRVIRAIEIFKSGGSIGDFSNDLKLNEKFDAKIVVLNRDRKLLYDRINMRVDLMFENGLIDEVKRLYNMGYTKEMPSMQGIGYKEVIDFFDDKIDLKTSKELIKQGTRRYAKRQLTWFKRYEDALWLYLDKHPNLEEQINIIKNFYGGNNA